ncbi:MAG TPA: PDZ domain-containing protein [Pirellulales bacterium]|nr:PDZ domain-containing protein [Pirellulales bacterium]
MRRSRHVWLKWLWAGTLAVVASPVSAQVFQPFALAAASDEAGPEENDYWIGVRCTEVPPLLQAQLDLPAGQGVLVDVVVPEGPADRAGLKAYDVIAAVDGKPVADAASLAAAVAGAGDRELKIDYLRGGRKQTLSVKPEPRPEAVAPREQDQRSIRQWVEHLGRGAGPMNFRFFHPGRVLPPGTSLVPALPDDMKVTIEKEGDKPAKVTAKRGDHQWEASEDSLESLPDEARQYAERMLGLGAFHFDVFEPAPPGRPATGFPRPFSPSGPLDAESRLNKRLEEMNRQIDDLRKAVEKLQKE